MMKRCLSIAGFLFLFKLVYAQQQEKIELLNANILEGDERLGRNAARLSGNVQFRHEGALMYCDSAYRFNDENRFEAFGRVRIVKDSLTITGSKLLYTGKNSLAIMKHQVVMSDGKMTLTTDELHYNLNEDKATYHTGAVIRDGENNLTSRQGIYVSSARMLYFRDSVLLDNPRYRLTCDSMQYSPVQKTAFFTGYTLIESKGDDRSWIYCHKGWYETVSGRSWFGKDTYIVSKEQTLYSDSLFYDSRMSVGRAFRNVKINDHANHSIVTGNEAYYDDRQRFSFVTGKSELIQILDGDSLFLHADTLHAVWDSLMQNRTWYAFHHCRFYKSDLQGKCDSIVYSSSDSAFRLFGMPVLWNEKNQLTADSVHILTANRSIDRMMLFNTAFIASAVDSMRFDQIRGKNMTGYFKDGKLDYIRVEGNGQTVYHVMNRKKKITGVNRADCTDITIKIKDGRVSGIHLYVNPEGTLFPLSEARPEDFRLKGFSWQESRRPVSRDDIFVWK